MTESSPGERERLQALIAEHHGNLSEIAKGMGIKRQVLTRRLVRHELLEDAARARAVAGISGPRTELDRGSADAVGEKATLLDLLAKARGYRTAAKQAGLSESTMIRKMRRLGIDSDAVNAHREKLKAG